MICNSYMYFFSREDIHLSRVTKASLTEPASYTCFFEHAIDSDVHDPIQCQDHSEMPTAWLELDERLGYGARVKLRIKSLYKSGLG
jgi:hypothetical protein